MTLQGVRIKIPSPLEPEPACQPEPDLKSRARTPGLRPWARTRAQRRSGFEPGRFVETKMKMRTPCMTLRLRCASLRMSGGTIALMMIDVGAA